MAYNQTVSLRPTDREAAPPILSEGVERPRTLFCGDCCEPCTYNPTSRLYVCNNCGVI
jgi:hypothetical protein